MNKLINAVASDGKKINPAKKYAVIAALITAAALVVAVVILAVSSIAFALGDDSGEQVVEGEGGGSSGGSSSGSSKITYATIIASELDKKVDGLTDFTARSKREIEKGTNNLYYAQNGVEKLSSGTMSAAHDMLVAFYDNNKSALNTDIGANSNNKDCTIPLLIDENADGTSFKIVVFGNDKTIYNNETYKWLYTNAYKYGFITKENTFTYVGVAVANYMQINNKNGSMETVEQLVSRLSANNGQTVSTAVTAPGATKATNYSIYYVSASGELKVPSNYEYTVQKDGTKGYIITVNLAKKVATADSTKA